MEQFEKIASYAFGFNSGGQRDYSQLTPEEVGAVVDERALKVLAESPEMGDSAESYMQAVEKVLKADEALKRAYSETDLIDAFLGPIAGKARTEPALAGRKQTIPLRQNRTVGAVANEVDAAVQVWLKKTGSEDYQAGLREVLAADPDLKMRYARGY